MFLLVQIFTFCVKRVYTFCYNLIRFSFPWHFLTFTKTSDKRVYKELLLFEKQTTKDKLKSQKRQINYSQYQWQYFNRWKKNAHTATLWYCLNNEVDLLTLKKIIFHRCFKWSFLFFWPTHDVWFVNHSFVFWKNLEENTLHCHRWTRKIELKLSDLVLRTGQCVVFYARWILFRFLFSDQANNSSAVDSLPLLNHNADFTKNELAVSLSCFWFENRGWANEENYFYFNANVTRRSQNRSICRLWSSYDLIAVQVIFFYMEKDLCFQRVWP